MRLGSLSVLRVVSSPLIACLQALSKANSNARQRVSDSTRGDVAVRQLVPRSKAGEMVLRHDRHSNPAGGHDAVLSLSSAPLRTRTQARTFGRSWGGGRAWREIYGGVSGAEPTTS